MARTAAGCKQRLQSRTLTSDFPFAKPGEYHRSHEEDLARRLEVRKQDTDAKCIQFRSHTYKLLKMEIGKLVEAACVPLSIYLVS